MRYFIFYYVTSESAYGSITCQCRLFPTKEEIMSEIIGNAAITGFNEFESERDYKRFMGES